MKFKNTIELALISLLILSLLLPIGMLFSVGSSLFLVVFFLHLVPLCIASLGATFELFQESSKCNFALKLLLLLSIGVALFSIIPSAILPVTARDALIHHLAIPKLWITHGLIYPTPWHEWSFYPMLIQLAFTALLQIGPEQLCSFYILLFLPLILLTTAKITALLNSNKEAPIVSCIALLITPIILKLSSVPLVDLPLVFFCGAGIYYLLKRQENTTVTRYSYLAGIAWGLALSCKLNALPAFGLALLIFFATSFRLHRARGFILRQYLIISLLALACFSPWLIKNWLWASNPLYPYLSSIFGQHIPKFDSGLVGLNPLQQRLMLYKESALEVILLPLRIFMGGEEDNPRLFDGRLSILFLIGLIYGALKLKDPKHRQLTFYCIAFILFALLSTAARVRYLTPVLAALAALTASALADFGNRNKLSSALVTLAILTQLLSSSIYLFRSAQYFEALAYFQGSLSKTQYLNAKIPEYPVIEFCNSQVQKDAKISLIYTGNQFYLYDRQVFSAGHTSADQIISWLNHSETLAAFVSKVKESRLTHFIIEDYRLQALMQTSLDANQKHVWNEFRLQNLSPLFSANRFTLYSIQ